MKKLKYILFCIIVLGVISAPKVEAQFNILKGPQGGTNIGTATAGDVGKCLKVFDDAPVLVWEMGTCGSGGGGGADGNWVFFNGSGIRLATTTNQVLIGASSTTTTSALEVIGRGYFSSLVGIASTSPWGLFSINPNNLGTNIPSFVVGSSTATRFIVANTGNVGVGTTSPTFKFEVNGTSYFSDLVKLQNGMEVRGGGIDFYDNLQMSFFNTQGDAFAAISNTSSVSGQNELEINVSGNPDLVISNSGLLSFAYCPFRRGLLSTAYLSL